MFQEIILLWQILYKLHLNLSKDKTCIIANSIGRALVKKNVLMLRSNDIIDIINNSDIFDTCKDLYLNEKELEEKILQDIQSENDLMVWVGAKKADGMVITVTAKENAIKKAFG